MNSTNYPREYWDTQIAIAVLIMQALRDHAIVTRLNDRVDFMNAVELQQVVAPGWPQSAVCWLATVQELIQLMDSINLIHCVQIGTEFPGSGEWHGFRLHPGIFVEATAAIDLTQLVRIKLAGINMG